MVQPRPCSLPPRPSPWCRVALSSAALFLHPLGRLSAPPAELSLPPRSHPDHLPQTGPKPVSSPCPPHLFSSPSIRTEICPPLPAPPHRYTYLVNTPGSTRLNSHQVNNALLKLHPSCLSQQWIQGGGSWSPPHPLVLPPTILQATPSPSRVAPYNSAGNPFTPLVLPPTILQATLSPLSFCPPTVCGQPPWIHSAPPTLDPPCTTQPWIHPAPPSTGSTLHHPALDPHPFIIENVLRSVCLIATPRNKTRSRVDPGCAQRKVRFKV